MKETDQAYNWITVVDNANITVLVLKAKPCDHMPSFDDNRNEIVGSVVFQILEDGSLGMKHCEMGDGL